MTVFMSVLGLFVFTISVFTVGFTAAFKRLMAFVLAGFVIDLLIIALFGTTLIFL